MIIAPNGKPVGTPSAQQEAVRAFVAAVSAAVCDEKLVKALGPFAQMFQEFMQRQQALEDHVGFTYVPKSRTDVSRGERSGGQ